MDMRGFCGRTYYYCCWELVQRGLRFDRSAVGDDCKDLANSRVERSMAWDIIPERIQSDDTANEGGPRGAHWRLSSVSEIAASKRQV